VGGEGIGWSGLVPDFWEADRDIGGVIAGGEMDLGDGMEAVAGGRGADDGVNGDVVGVKAEDVGVVFPELARGREFAAVLEPGPGGDTLPGLEPPGGETTLFKRDEGEGALPALCADGERAEGEGDSVDELRGGGGVVDVGVGVGGGLVDPGEEPALAPVIMLIVLMVLIVL
jgi:hypothetical protein